MHVAPVRLILAADHPMVRQDVRAVLVRSARWRLVQEIGGGENLLAATLRHSPQLVLLAIGQGEGQGLGVVQVLRTKFAELRILVLAERSDVLDGVIRAGADGCLLWEDVRTELEAGLEAALDGGLHFSPCLHRVVVQGFLHSRTPSLLDILQPDERELLQLLAEGRELPEAARRLSLSAAEAEQKQRVLMSKIGARSTAELVRYAVRSGLLEP